MLYDTEVLIKWNPSNRDHYMSKGFEFTKWHDEIVVKIEDASPSCMHEIRLNCDYCHKDYTDIVHRFRNRYKNIHIEKHACEDCFSILLDENKLYKKIEFSNNRAGENEFVVFLNNETVTIKKCRTCGMYKEIACFKKNGVSVSNQCVDCFNDFYKDNELNIKLAHIKERANEKGLQTTLTIDELKSIYERFDRKCALSNSLNFHCEHFIPLNWGHGGTVFGNIYLLDGSLNIKKGSKNPFNWINKARGFDKRKWKGLINYLASCNKLTIKEFTDFVNWCEKNKRTKEQILKDGDISSIELWKSSIGKG